jgi:UDP-glucose 4-epimerase
VLNGGGLQTRDFIFVDDLVEAIVKSAALTSAGEIFQISTGHETSIAGLAEIMSDILGGESGLRPAIEYGPPLKGEILRNYADNSKARTVLGWQPRYSLEEGILEHTRWFLAEKS